MARSACPRVRRLWLALLGGGLGLGLAACGGGGDDGPMPAAAPGQGAQAPNPDCVPVEEGTYFVVRDGRLAPASAPDPIVIEREAPRSWAERLEDRFPDLGFPWLKLDARNASSGVVTLTGLAPTPEAKEAAFEAGEAAIKGVPEGRDLLIVDGISVEGGDEPVGAALGELDEGPTVQACQDAFTQVMQGRNVSFGFGGSRIDEQSARLLDAASGVAMLCQDYEIEIGGHTDKVGDAIRNQRLSENRAVAVRQYLIDRGVPPGSLRAVGYGEAELLDTSDTEAAHARNRRTEFTVREAR